MPAGLGSAQCPPGNAVAGVVEAAHRTPKAVGVRQHVFFRYEYALHDDLAGDRGAQRELALDLRRAQALHALVEDEALDAPLIVFRPDDKHVGDRRIGNPHLGTRQLVAAVDGFRAGLHAARVGAVIRLGQPEAADELARGEFRQVLFPLSLAAISVDRVHDEARLHAHHRAVAGIDPLDLARDQAVADVVEPRAAVAVDRRPQ